MADQLFDLTGRTAVVTGAASGLAQAIALGFAERGVDLVVADINDEGLASTVQQIDALGRRAVAVHCDVSDAAQVSQLFQTADQTFDHIDILLNAPFYFDRVAPETMTLEQWNHALAV